MPLGVKKGWAWLSREYMADAGRVLVMVITGVVVVAWLLLFGSGAMSDPLSAFYVLYCGQFSLFAAVVLAALKRRTSAGAITLGIVTAVGVSGLIGTLAIQRSATGSTQLLGLKPQELLALLPVIPAAVAALPIGAVAMSRRLRRAR